jgi:cytidylate kinase
MALVLGFSGKRGSGKSTISQSVAEALNWRRTGFGDYVRGEAKPRDLDESLENLQAIGEELVARGPETFCRAVLRQADWEPGDSLVVDGIRHVEVVAALRAVIAPDQFRLVYISLAEDVREARLSERDNISRGGARQYDAHSTEAQVESLSRIADLVVDGSLPDSKITEKIVRWVQHTSRG